MVPKPRARFSRTKAGCMTCRSRKKKCDQIKPRCAGCRRNELICNWPPGVSNDPDEQPQDQLSAKVSSPLPSSPLSIVIDVGGERAGALTPQSAMLLEHYLSETVSFFAMTRMKDNPFLTILLRIGYTDDLLMHGLLALSGAHMTYKDPDNFELITATRLHYSRLIGGLRTELTSLDQNDLSKAERLLRILLVAAHYEVVSGDTKGTMFNHLRASRYLVQSLTCQNSIENASSSDQLRAQGFCVELYTYLVITNTITPYGTSVDRSLPLDSYIMSPEELSSFPTFGAMFAGSHELYQLIPEVSLLASHRLTEEAAGAVNPTASLQHTYDNLHNRITSWEMPPPPVRPGEVGEDFKLKHSAAEVFRQGLYIFLATALAGTIVSDPQLLSTIDGHLIKLFGHAEQVIDSQYTVSLLWPIVVAGSCMVKPEYQHALVREIQRGEWKMKHLDNTINVLQLLWDDPDPRAYGPYGLHLIMDKHGLSLCLA